MKNDVFVCALRELVRRKSRTLTSVTGYFLAITILVVLANFLIFAKIAKDGILNNLGTHFIAFKPGFPDIASGSTEKVPLDPQNEAFFSDPSRTKIFPLSLLDSVRKIPQVKAVSPFLLYRLKDMPNGTLMSIGGFDPGDPVAACGTSLLESDIISGTFIKPGDRGVVLLEEGFASYRELKVGMVIEIAGIVFPVIGIVRTGIRPAKADIYLPFDDAEKVINRRLTAPLASEANVMLVEVASGAYQEKAIDEVKKVFPGCIIDTYACFIPAVNVMGMSERGGWLVLFILGIGVILFSVKSQMASVIERRHDIGILKAIGWTDAAVIGQIILESLIQALIGGAMGCLAGSIIIWRVPIKVFSGIITGFDPMVSPWVLGTGLSLAIIGGIIAGAIPALAHARSKPAEALMRI